MKAHCLQRLICIKLIQLTVLILSYKIRLYFYHNIKS
nr:MAG TPA: hypothetical protein [Caudoviricetes sp.]